MRPPRSKAALVCQQLEAVPGRLRLSKAVESEEAFAALMLIADAKGALVTREGRAVMSRFVVELGPGIDLEVTWSRSLEEEDGDHVHG